MKVLVILNGISGKRRAFQQTILPALQREFTVVVWETTYAGHAENLALAGCQEKFDLILCAGGDGTLHQVVNGVLRATSHLPTVGLIPLGSGNDFARTVHAHADANQLISLIQANQPRLVDVGVAHLHNQNNEGISRYFINVCSLGMGPEVVKQLAKSEGRMGPSLTYLQAIVRTFLSLRSEHLQIKTSEWEWVGNARVFAMANGRAFGHAVYIAPDAKPDDGQLHFFLAGDIPLWRFLLFLQTIKLGKKVKHAAIRYGCSDHFEVTSKIPLPVEAEGELIGFTPLRCEVLSQKLKFLY